MIHYWSEPYKHKSLWYIDKISNESGNRLQNIEFTSKKLADAFLNTVHIYVDGKLVYDGI